MSESKIDAGSGVALARLGVAHIHVPRLIGAIGARDDVRVAWVWDHDPRRAEARAAELGARVAQDPEQALSDPGVDGVGIFSESDRHPPLVKATALARKHLFVEKPLGLSTDASLEMARAVEDAGVLFSTGYFMRMDPKHKLLKDLIEAGSFGTVTRASASYCHAGSLRGLFDAKPTDPVNDWQWMALPETAGSGAFGDLGTHVLDLLMWLFGAVERVTADIKVVTGRYGETDESGTALIRFAEGVTATLAAGWVDVHNPVTLHVSGTSAHAHVLNDELHLEPEGLLLSADERGRARTPRNPVAPFNYFVDALLGGSHEELVSPAVAASRVAVMEAMYEAARQGSWVAIS
jgi:predicted dehydrogenase